jgi:hypothetical protein
LRRWWGDGVRQLGERVHERLDYLHHHPGEWRQYFPDITEPKFRKPSRGAQPVSSNSSSQPSSCEEDSFIAVSPNGSSPLRKTASRSTLQRGQRHYFSSEAMAGDLAETERLDDLPDACWWYADLAERERYERPGPRRRPVAHHQFPGHGRTHLHRTLPASRELRRVIRMASSVNGEIQSFPVPEKGSRSCQLAATAVTDRALAAFAACSDPLARS